MPMSTDVNLPKQHPARFPDKCVVCGYAAPGATVRVITGTIGWWTWVLWMFGKPFVVKAPACPMCGWWLHLRRLASLAVTLGLVLLAFWLAYPWVRGHVPAGARKWVMMGVGLACLIPQLAYELLHPPAFNLTAYRDSVDYEFRDAQLAQEFAELNEDAEWVKIE